MSDHLADPRLTKIYRLEVTLGEVLDLGDTPYGRRRIAPLVEGTFAGPDIRGQLVAGSSADWQIGLQKTGYIAAAGRCLVMQTVIEGRRVVMVLLDSLGRYSRFADAQRIRDWLVERGPAVAGPRPATLQ